MVKNVCASCHTCQITKTKKVKYGKLPLKEVEATPWDVLCIDLIGPYEITNNNKKLTLWALTMIDPATGWFDMASIKTKTADVIANKLEHTWLTKYPRPTKVILDRGTEFMRMRVLHHDLHQVFKRCRGIDADNVDPGNHDVIGGHFADVENIGDQHSFAGINRRFPVIVLFGQFLERVA